MSKDAVALIPCLSHPKPFILRGSLRSHPRMTAVVLWTALPPSPTLPLQGGREQAAASAAALSRHAQVHAGLLLQIADEGEEIFRLRIAARAEHADRALGRRAGRLTVLCMIFSENRFPSPIGVEDMLFGIMHGRAVRSRPPP